MQSAIVTVKLSGRQQEYDLEVPTEVPSRQLAELILHNLGSTKSIAEPYSVRCLKPEAFKRTLRSEESLAAAGLWDGAFLEIEPVGAIARKKWKDIVERWEPLQLGDTGKVLAIEQEPSLIESTIADLLGVEEPNKDVPEEPADLPDVLDLPQTAGTISPVTGFEPIRQDAQPPTVDSGSKLPDLERGEESGGPKPPRTTELPWKDIGRSQ